MSINTAKNLYYKSYDFLHTACSSTLDYLKTFFGPAHEPQPARKEIGTIPSLHDLQNYKLLSERELEEISYVAIAKNTEILPADNYPVSGPRLTEDVLRLFCTVVKVNGTFVLAWK